MIQIIEKVFNILDIISKEEKLQLKDIAEGTGIKKTALSNILKSLSEAGVIEKVDGNKYQIGPRLTPIISPRMNRNKLAELADETARLLAAEINEASLVSVLFEGERYLIANSNASRSVTVDANFNKRPTICNTATGRVLMAFADEDALARAIDKNGFPCERWDNIRSMPELKKAFEKIHRDKTAILFSGDGEAVSLAVPVFAANGRLAAALGVHMPSHRFAGEHKGAVLRGLKNAGERMSNALKIFEVMPL